MSAKPVQLITATSGSIGRGLRNSTLRFRGFLRHTSGICHLAVATLYFSVVGLVRSRHRTRRQFFVMMRNVGVSSFPIVALVSFLIGAILVLQSGEPLKRFGQIQEVPGAVALTLTREISPLLTAIIMTARVGASFTAVLASMRINEEVLALETMAIHPIAHLVAPRFLSMLIMLPCLTVFSYLVGMTGGAIVGRTIYALPYSLYVDKSVYYLTMTDIVSGLVKAGVFGVIIALVCCYYGLIVEGGSVGLGRNIMVSVVTSIVLIILADALATVFINNYIF
jgi:phospholipid/cholesterol/gamma-HCH transport system permease protein